MNGSSTIAVVEVSCARKYTFFNFSIFLYLECSHLHLVIYIEKNHTELIAIMRMTVHALVFKPIIL